MCLGMEDIRMVEQGVASPEDIDTAMVLGYRHPVAADVVLKGGLALELRSARARATKDVDLGSTATSKRRN